MVSVVMAVYNGAKYLSEAIGSILSQSYEDFEFIIVDDCSTDSSWDIVLKFHETDRRIRPVRLENNQGVATASNTGIKIARGKYIARMDSDDISLPERFAVQVNFLESNPHIGILGSRVRYIDEFGNLLGTPPTFQGDLSIRWHLLFENPFYNSTAMFQKSLIVGKRWIYDASALYGEDYKLWGRLLLTTKGENLSDILVYYRVHSSSLSNKIKDVLEREVVYASQIVQAHFPRLSQPLDAITELQGAMRGYPISAKSQRARLLPVYLSIWDEFSRKNWNESGLFTLRKVVFAWAARMILYPPFQDGSLRALWLLTKAEWRWPLFLFWMLPLFLVRRRF